MVSPSDSSSATEGRAIAVCFLLMLGLSLWAVSVGWRHEGLYGNEFRETQTAQSAQFIRHEGGFSLAYPTPVLGKPWSVPMEFPLYQWATVGASNRLGLTLAEAGRLVSVSCFYLGLPALFLILRRWGLGRAHGLVVLSLVLGCPFYLFYARSFLIETMALMFGLWYFLALVRAVEQRQIGWLVLANVAGIGAGLVKVTTFLVFVAPAFAASLGWLWLAVRSREQPAGRAVVRTTGWLIAAHALPFAATLWWIDFADAVKRLNPSGALFTSEKLAGFNFGRGRRFEAAIWAEHWRIISHEIAPPVVLLVAAVAALVLARRWWRPIAGCVALYLLVQATFPLLYAWHSYYHVASAFLLLTALGLALVGVFEARRLPRFVPFGLWLAVSAIQAAAYFQNCYPIQREPGNPGGLVAALREITRPGECVVVAGDDWNSAIPYYADRRALMILGQVADDEAHLRRAFAAMQRDPVGALVLLDGQRQNALVRRLAAKFFEIEAEPAFTWHDRGRDAAVYLHRQLRREARAVLKEGHFHAVQIGEGTESAANPLAGAVIEYAKLLPRHQALFRTLTPRPVRFSATFGPEVSTTATPGDERFSIHPKTTLWFGLTPGRHRLRAAVEIVEGAYNGVPRADATDGVEIVASAVWTDGRREILQRRYLNPRDQLADRGRQAIDWTFDLAAGAELELNVNEGPYGSLSRDWAGLFGLTIE